jgi:small subunit ribosomal protein S19e
MTEAIVQSVDINKKKGGNVLDVCSNLFIQKLAEFFKEKDLIKLPKWGTIVKCSHANELSPNSADWFYTKAAAVARQIYLTKSKTLGVGTLKRMFGKKKRRGSQAPTFMEHSGKILRTIVKQLKNIEYLENRVLVLEEVIH